MSVIETAPAFDLPGVDGRDRSLDEYAEAPVLVLVQSCNHCPYVLAWEDRINELQRKYEERGVRIVAISSNDAEAYPVDSFDAMVEHARDADYVIDYLYDESQIVALASDPSGHPRRSFSTQTARSSTAARSTTTATRPT